MGNQSITFREGDRVVLTADVERFPWFIAPKGLEGSVVEVSEDGISVRMDETIEGCEMWLNEITWVLPEDTSIELALTEG